MKPHFRLHYSVYWDHWTASESRTRGIEPFRFYHSPFIDNSLPALLRKISDFILSQPPELATAINETSKL